MEELTAWPPEVYDKIDVKMDQRRLKQREKKMREQIKAEGVRRKSRSKLI